MNKFWKGFGVCTFLCMIAAAPSWADICFLPTGTCEQGAQAKVAETKSCDDYIDQGIYFASEQPDMTCSLADIPGCTLFECTAKSCEARGFKLGPTYSEKTYPQTYSETAFHCTPCQQGGQYMWKCEPLPCLEGYYVKDDPNHPCAEGEIWSPVAEGGMSGRENCGICVIDQCPQGEGIVSEDDLPTSDCWTCSHIQNLESGKSCYRCTKMDGEYVTAAAKEDMDESCYTFSSKPSSTGETCYLPKPLECPINQYVNHDLRGEKTYCSCQDYVYEFAAGGDDVIDDGSKTEDGHNSHESKILHYTAAGGVKKVNIKSTQTGEETIVWPYSAPSASGECSIDKSGDGALLKVTCPKNLTTTEKGSTFTITQTEADEASVHTIDIKIIIDPDTCDNPNDVVAACSNELGRAPYEKGPRPACYKTHLDAACNLDGYVPLDSGHKSVAGQACYYCVNDNCPSDYEKGETPAPAEGYLTEATDVGSNCYKERPCPDGYSTQYPDINACTKNGHPEGWSYTSDGLCGAIPCGKCTPNVCTGEGKDVKCQAAPFCDPAQPSCGYKDPSTEYEGDTPKYNANIKPCPEGTSTTQKQGCGTNVDSGYRSGEQVCWKYNEPDRTCSTGFTYDESKCSCQPIPCPSGTSVNKTQGCGTNTDSGSRSGTNVCWKYNEPNRTCSEGFSYNESTCSCVCTRTCGTNEDLDPTTCTCKEKPFVCPIGDGGVSGQPGTWGSACTEDSQCQSSSDYSLICVNKDEHGCGECKECGVYNHNGSVKKGLDVCKIKGIRDKGLKWFYVPATSSQSCDITIGNHCLVKDPTQKQACGNGEYPDVAHSSSDAPYHFKKCQKPYEGEEAWECTADGECIWNPNPGWMGDDCKTDADCNESSDFPLYCFHGKCAECDVYSTCEVFMTDSSRFKKKYGSSTKSIKLSARDGNNVRVRYAGRETNITELQEGYKNRFYCTAHGECSACKTKDGDGVCSYFDNNKGKQVHYICDSNKKGAPCYEAVNDKKTKTLLFYHW